MSSSPLVIVGCGFIGNRLARAALAAGRHVRVCARTTGRLEPLRQLGAEVKFVNATRPKQHGPALLGLTSPTVVYAIPPLPQFPGGEAMSRATQAAINAGAGAFIYLSSAGLYGDHPDPDWVDETSTVSHEDPSMTPYQTEEAVVTGAAAAGLRAVTFRLAAVYGGGKGVRMRLRKKDYKILDDGQHYVSRIHIDDLVRIIFAAEERGTGGSLYLVGDDRPTTQKEYLSWLSTHLGLPMPPFTPALAPGAARKPWRGRRIKNELLKRELGVSLLYPTFLEGEAQIDAEEGGEAPSLPTTAPPPPPPAPRPDFIRHVATIEEQAAWQYPGSDEKMIHTTPIGDAVGLKRTGIGIDRIPPGRRASFPHAHSAEEELIYVMEGAPDVWLDGTLHRLGPGDVVGFPPGTGISHTFINNTAADVKLLVVGERRPEDKVIYPLNPERQGSIPAERRWEDRPKRELGPHDGMPKKR